MTFVLSFAPVPSPLWLQILQAGLIPAVAIVAAIIAYGQWRTAKQQWRTAHQSILLDLYERRLAVLDDVETVIRNVGSSANANGETLRLMYKARSRARFLFGDDVLKFLDEILDDVAWRNVFTDEVIMGDPENLQKHVKEKFLRLKRLLDFRSRGEALFAPYLRFDQRIV